MASSSEKKEPTADGAIEPAADEAPKSEPSRSGARKGGYRPPPPSAFAKRPGVPRPPPSPAARSGEAGPTVRPPRGRAPKSSGTRISQDDASGAPAVPPAPPVPRSVEPEGQRAPDHVERRSDPLPDDGSGDARVSRDSIDVLIDEPMPEAPARPSIPPAALPEPVAHFDRYSLLGRLAVGGMAEVWLARERAEGGASRMLALKFVRPQLHDDEGFVTMFLNEGRVALGLTHPNICHIYEFGRKHGRYYIAMEWVNGVTLSKMLKRGFKRDDGVPIPLLLRIFSQTAEALDYAHRARDEMGRKLGLVHRDVSPHNIMVSYDGVVKLLDFGVAKAKLQAHATQSGALKGKFAYMSPEQVSGLEMDCRTDVFSLGICLYEALTGQRLYQRAGEYETLKAIMEEEPPSVRAVRPELPEELDRIVKKALTKRPEDRYATAAELQQELEHFLADQREVVSASRIARYMDETYADEIAKGPQLEVREDVTDSFRLAMRPSTPSGKADAVHAHEEVAQPVDAAPARPRRALLAAAAALALGLLGLGGWAAWPSGDDGAGRAEPSQPTASAGEGAEPSAAGGASKGAGASEGAGGGSGEAAGQGEAAGPAAAIAADATDAGAAEQAEAEQAEAEASDAGTETAEASGEQDGPVAEADEGESEAADDEERERRRREWLERRRRQRERTRSGFVTDPGF